ncbi:NAD-dependent epimerase/dehydratase family protein [Nitrosopumilus maritimus]|uniref:NAD-dependent epimerase/dehydratase n=1 Tax=Nitrosopumilus maritimus (strain SCM1) TaxID=436308 RepID=A9A160_NITMS|nr:NAD(P)-dependent oxidoreductase [Nitrosopumilus maritimus]ABX12021.1 NAD-dependent epimerase/dehydratase [Nitrosopumilus maritimus SCM1]
MKKQIKILVTGASGMLGNKIISELSNSDYQSLGISKKNTHTINNTIIKKCDITNYKQLKKIFDAFKPNIIIHTASITGNIECEENPEKTFLVNCLGTFNILNLMKKNGAKIIFCSSREVYGNSKKKVTEKDLEFPINLNGITKITSENLIKKFHQTYNVQYVILRFTNFYGDLNSKRGISLMIKNAIKNKQVTIYGGKQILNLLHIDDAVKAILLSIKYKNSNTFNIGSDEKTTLPKLIKIIENNINQKIKINKKNARVIEPQKFVINIKKAKNELGFTPNFTLDLGIKKLVKEI